MPSIRKKVEKKNGNQDGDQKKLTLTNTLSKENV